MNKNRFISGAIVIGLAVFLVGCSAVRPLHRSEASIRASLLKRTPQGTTYQEVAAFLQKQGWELDVHTKPLSPEGWLNYSGAAGKPATQPVGITLHADFGYYWVPPLYESHVSGCWLFDTNKQLLDVWVVKYLRGL